MRLIFDGHLDLALFALCHNRDQTEPVAQINAREAGMTDALERGGATVSLPEMRRAGVAVCQSSISARAKREVQPATGHRRIDPRLRHTTDGLRVGARTVGILPNPRPAGRDKTYRHVRGVRRALG